MGREGGQGWGHGARAEQGVGIMGHQEKPTCSYLCDDTFFCRDAGFGADLTASARPCRSPCKAQHGETPFDTREPSEMQPVLGTQDPSPAALCTKPPAISQPRRASLWHLPRGQDSPCRSRCGTHSGASSAACRPGHPPPHSLSTADPGAAVGAPAGSSSTRAWVRSGPLPLHSPPPRTKAQLCPFPPATEEPTCSLLVPPGGSLARQHLLPHRPGNPFCRTAQPRSPGHLHMARSQPPGLLGS